MRIICCILLIGCLSGCAHFYTWDTIAERCRDNNTGEWVDTVKCGPEITVMDSTAVQP